ncbi:MAG TPA: DsbA family protein [Steroidobacteraceae bacterium]|nr:DsbA family protein [Steroidobacteraceae bacterium]
MSLRACGFAPWSLLLAAALAWTTVAHAQRLERVTRSAQIAIVRDPGPYKVGARDPDVTIVEYFDYNCPFCRRLAPTLRRLLAEDPRLALIYKDWPVLGPASVYAARCALAAAYQGKYLQAHDALLAGPRLSSDAEVEAVLGRAGIDVARMKADLRRHAVDIARVLNRNDDEARALALQGTPGLLVGRTLVPGIIGRADLHRLIAQARRRR